MTKHILFLVKINFTKAFSQQAYNNCLGINHLPQVHYFCITIPKTISTISNQPFDQVRLIMNECIDTAEKTSIIYTWDKYINIYFLPLFFPSL